MKINDLSYEEAMKELKDILDKLDGEDLKLDESIEMFRTASLLYDHCNNLIEKAEGEIKIIMEKDNKIEEVDFTLEG